MTRMHFDGAIFDMDGVITDTAAVHFSAWKITFDAYFQQIEAKVGRSFREFTRDDYMSFVDGRPRYDGVAAFLASRGLALPMGNPEDAPGDSSVCGVGNRKDAAFNRLIEMDGVEVFDSSVVLIRDLCAKGVRVGIATSSKNCDLVLRKAGLAWLFQTSVDGITAAELKLKGKPAPDIFTLACDRLGATADRTVIVEDAVSGIQAGVRGGFGLVLGVARDGNEEELRRNGAGLIVSDLSQISAEQIDRWFALRSAAQPATAIARHK